MFPHQNTEANPFGQNLAEDTNPNSSLASGESSMAGQGLIIYNKTILVKPDELTFNQVQVNLTYTQVLTMQNTLSAPVEIILKSSNQERLEVTPKCLKLAPHESCQVTATFRQPRPFPAKTQRQKETIFIKSDFFDQKVAVVIIPAAIVSADVSSTSTSLQRATPQGRVAAFQNASVTMTRQQLATTTIGKSSGELTRPSQSALSNNDLGVNDSFGRATTDDVFNVRHYRPEERKRQEFSPAIQQSDHVEVTLAADSKADITSGVHYLGSEFDRDQEIASAKKRIFESHESSLMRQQLNEIRRQNEELKVQLATALAKQYSSESSTQSTVDQGNIEKIKLLLREREPKLEELLTEAMKHERNNQKRKDAKILEILQFKDQQITELTQAMVDYRTLKNSFEESQEKLAAVTDQLREATSRLQLFDASEEKFQELIKSQNKVDQQQDSIGVLEAKILTLQGQIEQNNNARVFLDEACTRAKSQAVLIQGRLDAAIANLGEERQKCNKLEEQVQILRQNLNKSAGQGKDSNNDRETRIQLQRSELENAQLQEKVFQMQEQMQQVYQTLSKVTGENTFNNNLLNSESRESTDGGNDRGASQISGFDDRLAQRAEEIILIVEQVQSQYTLLEKEMRSLVKKASTHVSGVQTELKMAEIDDMRDHFQALQAQVREKTNEDSDNQYLLQQLNESRQEIDRLNEVIRSFKNIPRKQTTQYWLHNGSNENLLTNRASSNIGEEKSSMGPSDILISERGALDQQRLPNLVLSKLSASHAGQNHGQLLVNNSSSAPGSNRQIAEMQDREKQLLEQLSFLKEQMRFQTSHSESNMLGGDQNTFAQEHLQLRIGELETLVFQQREQLLTLQDHNSNLKQQLAEQIDENRHKLELYEVRNHNLQELNRKYQDAAKSYGGRETLHTYTSGVIGTSPDNKSSTQVETERTRQLLQQTEMKNMDLQHLLKETQISLKHVQRTKEELSKKVIKYEQEFAQAHQNSLLQKAGVNLQDSKLAMLVQELKNRLRKIEASSEGKIYQNQKNNRSEQAKDSQALGTGQASLYALREEYCTKIEKLIEQNAVERTEAQGQIMTLKQKVDGQITQLKAMEEKEIKLFSQLEDVRSQKTSEEDLWNARFKDLQSILDSKQQVCSDLEREVKQKEKMLAERQEQLSILLSAMEQQSSLSQSSGHPGFQQNSPLENAKQRLANMAAELCSLKAVEAQMERRCADMSYNERQILQKSQKLEQTLEDTQVKQAILVRKIQTQESTIELLERQKHDLSNRLEEIEREKTDHQYKLERLMFQLKTKEETILWLKQQSTQAEIHFKEQVDRIKDDLITKHNVATLGRNRGTQQISIMYVDQNSHMTEHHRPRREIALKIAIQQLHLVIADYIERTGSEQKPTSMEEAQKNIIQEMEKALGVAQTTIQRLEGDLDHERYKGAQLDNEWDALALNGILMTRQEKMSAQIKSVGKLLSEREQSSMLAQRQQLDSLNRVIREQELKLDSQSKLVTELGNELQEIKQVNHKLSSENEELQTNIMCVQQEQAGLKLTWEKKAQISVDERHRQRTDALQTYFDGTVAKLMIDSPDYEKAQVLGRELSALQLLVDKQRRQIDLLQANQGSLENSLRFYKGQFEEQETKIRYFQTKAAHSQMQLEKFSNGGLRSVQLDKQKEECLSLEKELIRYRETAEMKAREVTSLLQHIESHKFDGMQTQLGQDLQQIAQKKKDAVFGIGEEQANKKIQLLQEQLMEIREYQIQELEELKIQCDLDVAEARRELSKQQLQFEHKFMPGTAPGEILDQNHELRERVAKLQSELDNLCQENDFQRNQLYDYSQQNELLHNQLQERMQALADLETSLITQHPNTTGTGTAPLKSALKQRSSSGTSAKEEDCQGMMFTFTPPAIIRELFSAKRAELVAKQKLRIQLQTEVKLRQRLTNQLQDEIKQQKQDSVEFPTRQPGESTTFGVSEEVVAQLMVQNANILSILQDGSLALDTGTTADYEECNTMNAEQNRPDQKTVMQADLDLLVKTVIHFANQLAQKTSQDSLQVQQQSGSLLQQASLKMVTEAQRVVIRCLTKRHPGDRIKYAPELEVDRKVWYLELLEEQVADAENQTTKLQDFVKRLQIGVSGSLHSAAEIKASSMDLAQHLKQASEEIKTLKNVAGLIKHDVLSIQDSNKAKNNDFPQSSIAASVNNDFNPFLSGRNQLHTITKVNHEMDLQTNHLQQTQRSNMERLLNEHESMHNQLSLTSKIKHSLESELVQSKLQHASEMQNVIQRMSTVDKKLHELTQAKQQLLADHKSKDEIIGKREHEVSSLKLKLAEMEQSLQESKAEAIKAREGSKHWQKMQADMQDWRRTNDETLRTKQKQLQDAQEKITQLKADKKRMKAEVSMLRQNQKEIRDGSVLQNLKKENSELVSKFNEQLDERKKEIEFWVQERAQMRDRIDQLESVNVAPGGIFGMEGVEPSELQRQVEKLKKKIKSKETELKQAKSDLVAAKNKVSQAELKLVKMESQIRESSTNQTEAQNKLQLVQNRVRELEIEKEMLLARQREANVALDKDQANISIELDKLREEFARLKVQKDDLSLETKSAAEREREWRDTIDKLNRDLVSLKNSLTLKENESGEALSLQQKKTAALLSDLRFMRDENQKLHEKLREANSSVIIMEQQIAQTNQEQAQIEATRDILKRQVSEKDSDSRAKDLKIAEVLSSLQENETSYFNKLKILQTTLSEIKQESAQSSDLLLAQIETLKTKLLKEQKATGKEIEQSLALTQKETLLKHAKKDLVAAKAHVTKLKSKNKDLKNQLDKIPQRQPTLVPKTTNLAAGKKVKPTETTPTLLERELVERLAQTDGLKKLLQASKQVNSLESQVTESQLEIAKVENWNYTLQQQLDEAKSTLEQAEEKINDLMREKKEVVKAKSQAHNQSERALKEQVKTLTLDLEKMKEEWSSPEAVASQQEAIQALQAQVKQLQSQVQRKAKHLGQVKQQQVEASEGVNQVQNDLANYQAENLRLKAQLKEANKAEKIARDLRGTLEWLKESEKRLKEEILSLNEKLKGLRAELTRKDQHLKDYKDRMGIIQSEVSGTADLQQEVDKLKDINRKQRVELDVKENQVKTLRTRLEQNYSEIQTLSHEKNQIMQQDTEVEAKLRAQKSKAKRYETNLLKSMTALKKIGVELAALQQHKSSVESARFGPGHANVPGSPNNRNPIKVYRSSSAQGTSVQQVKQGDSPLDVNDLAKDAAYYKDSVEILGLSMNEMELFINPLASAGKHAQAAGQMHSASSLISSRGAPVSRTTANAGLLERLELIDRVSAPRDLQHLGNQEIEEIGEYCVKLIHSIM